MFGYCAVTDKLSSVSEALTTENVDAMKTIKELEARLASGKAKNPAKRILAKESLRRTRQRRGGPPSTV